MTTENMLSSILDGDIDQAKELFNEIMREKVLSRIDAIKDEVGFSLFNKDEFVTEDWSEDDVYLSLGHFAKAVSDIEDLNEGWDELSDEEKEPITSEEDDWYWDDEQEDVVNESKRHLVRYNEQYHTLLEEYKDSIMEELKMRVYTFDFNSLHEELKPFASRILSLSAEMVYESVAELSDELRDTVTEVVTEMFMNIFPLSEELSLVPLPAGYTPKKKESRSEYDANRAMTQKAKLSSKPIKPDNKGS